MKIGERTNLPLDFNNMNLNKYTPTDQLLIRTNAELQSYMLQFSDDDEKPEFLDEVPVDIQEAADILQKELYG